MPGAGVWTSAVALVLCSVVCQAAGVHPLEIQQSRYQMRAGEPAQIAASLETLDFLLKAKSIHVDLVDIAGGETGGLVAGPNHARDGILLAAPMRTKPGEY